MNSDLRGRICRAQEKMMKNSNNISAPVKAVEEKLGRPVVLIGMMGAGKSHVGRLLAEALDLEFVDSDRKIEEEAGCKISDIFEREGEEKFRVLEESVISALLGSGPVVVAVGGGAVMNQNTAQAIWDKAISIWLDADIDLLADRVGKSKKRPLLAGGDPKEILENLLKQREPIYRKADITVQSVENSVPETVNNVVMALQDFLGKDGC